MTTSEASERVGSRISARWRIVGWMLLVSTIGLATVAVTVRSMMLADTSRAANDAVVQEIEEFRTFAREARDPATAQPFAGTEVLFETYLRRQQLAAGEVVIGVLADGRTLEALGPGVDPRDVPQPGTDLHRDVMTGERSGVATVGDGELRYGREGVAVGEERGQLVVLAYTGPAVAVVDATSLRMLWVSLGAVLLTAAAAYVVADRILAPVRTVRQAAARIGERDLEQRIPVEGRDDVAELAVTFNAMLDRLEGAFDAERRFIDDAGHELRTPITVVRGHLETMPDDPQERRAVTALVLDELERMSRIVSDLLMLAKAERPDFVQLAGPVDLAELTVQLDHKVQALGDRRWVLTDIAEGPAVIDAHRATQAVLQLAHNAVRHTSPGAQIGLASNRVEDPELGPCVVLSVTDDGPGVAPGDVERIFERFDRGGSVRRNDDGGAGLGLAIVRAIADGHHGSAFVRSTPGQGATFGVALPVREDLLVVEDDGPDPDSTREVDG